MGSSYINENGLNTTYQEHMFDGLQEGINYHFINQSGFRIYARTFTTGIMVNVAS